MSTTVATSDPALTNIIELFRQISAIPRLSRHERQIRNWVKKWAKSHGFPTQQDRVGNIVIRVPASPSHRHAPSLILQAHLDMVGEKDPAVQHNFHKDPIVVHQKGDWLQAQGTTLGSDNGIGIALALYCAIDPLLSHPALELLFTVDEESGLTGAAQLDHTLVHSRHLINIDSEDEGILINGCAGGSSAAITLPAVGKENATPFIREILRLNRRAAVDRPQLKLAGAHYQRYMLEISGLPGGHSGVDINKARGNAIISAGELLSLLTKDDTCLVGGIEGGRAHNAIPRETQIVLYIREGAASQSKAIIDRFQNKLRDQHPNQSSIAITLKEGAAPRQSSPNQHSSPYRWLHSAPQLRRLCQLLLQLPNGVQRTIPKSAIPLLSANIARIAARNGADHILLSMRSSSETALRKLEQQVRTTATAWGATCHINGQYPAWEPASTSQLASHCATVYRTLFKRPLKIEIIHAGLEPAVIAHQMPELDMISIGPTLQYPHSPQERLSVSSTAKLYRFLAAILSQWSGGAPPA